MTDVANSRCNGFDVAAFFGASVWEESAGMKAQQELWFGCKISPTGSSAPSLGLWIVGLFKELQNVWLAEVGPNGWP